ncbi:MAG: hypothetical protein HOD90_07395 [Nitrospina sp.]|jgi:hypothetical protein|nr:hypothetical protein [Nitrospina sp.]MBT5969296.1 hypothetical protein [Nitrospina sp.]
MYEVRVYDGKGKLKNTISRSILEKRSNLILNTGINDKKFLRSQLLRLQRSNKRR